MKIYSEQQALIESSRYFDGDILAATTWINKYALRNEQGELLEISPKDMHDRMIKEILRIENNYDNPLLTEDLLKELFYNFRYVIPGGSIMSGLGNTFKHTSLSNCFVIESPCDSYGGIFRADQELVQLMKRRGGVGMDLSHLRPMNAKVTNDAKTSSGLVSFMDRFSNSCREVAQNGRRGALMLSCSVIHPDAEKFIDAKLQEGKVTGANISVKITNEFMKAVKDKQHFLQKFPITEDTWNLVDFKDDPSSCYELNGKALEIGKLYEGKKPGTYVRLIEAHKLWNKLMKNAWKSAEPGILFFDKITEESPADFYEGYQSTSTNPCGELPLCPYDSCRLIALNLYSYIDNPFTKKAVINKAKLALHAKLTQRIMDNIIDVELEHIKDIISKVESDPEDSETKRVELTLWNKIYEATSKGRRTGVGITAEGDMLAALGIQYGSEDSIQVCQEVHRIIATNCYMSSIDLAKERGSFNIFDVNELLSDSRSKFINRIYKELPEEYQKLWQSTGRRNIGCLTIAPTGTVSLMTQTTSGIEPAFKCWYIRRRKTSDKSKAVFTDEVGDMFEEFKVFQSKFVEWASIWYNEEYKNSPNKDSMPIFRNGLEFVESRTDDQLQALYEKSPWYKATAQDIDWVQKIKLQGAVQQWVDHSISCTVNVPQDTTVETVDAIYMAAFESGCKGCTIYRDGSRSGVLITKKSENSMPGLNTPRPDELPAKIVRFKNGNENWIAFIGMMNGNPYEIFTGKVDDDIRYLPKSITEGKIVRVATGPEVDGKVPHRYDFKYEISYGYTNTLPAISAVFKSEYWNYCRMISSMLRAGIPINQVLSVINGLNSDMGDVINTWKKGTARALRQFVKDGEKSGSKCTKCGAELIFQGGCQICPECGESKCE